MAKEVKKETKKTTKKVEKEVKNNTHEVIIKIEGKEWENCLDKAFKKAIKKVKIDGFRPGKAPKSVFLKKYGIINLGVDSMNPKKIYGKYYLYLLLR